LRGGRWASARAMIAWRAMGIGAGDGHRRGRLYQSAPTQWGTMGMTMDTMHRDVGDAIIVGGYINPPLRNGIPLEMTVSATHHNASRRVGANLHIRPPCTPSPDHAPHRPPCKPIARP